MSVAFLGIGAPSLVTAIRERAGSVSEIPLVSDPSLAGRALPDLSSLGAARDVVFLSAESAETLALLPRVVRALAPDGSLWVLSPRGRAEVGHSAVLAAGLSAGVVDADEVRITDRLTGVRFLHERRRRPRAAHDRWHLG
jgi:hypothetical protein